MLLVCCGGGAVEGSAFSVGECGVAAGGGVGRRVEKWRKVNGRIRRRSWFRTETHGGGGFPAGTRGGSGSGDGGRNSPVTGNGDGDGGQSGVRGRGAGEYPPPPPRAVARSR